MGGGECGADKVLVADGDVEDGAAAGDVEPSIPSDERLGLKLGMGRCEEEGEQERGETYL